MPCGIFDDPARVEALKEDAATVRKAMVQINELSAENTPLALNQVRHWGEEAALLGSAARLPGPAARDVRERRPRAQTFPMEQGARGVVTKPDEPRLGHVRRPRRRRGG